MNRGVMGRQMFAKGGPAFPDLSGDGQITQKDILMGRGVVPMSEGGATLSEEDYFAKAGLSKADYEGLSSQDQMRLMQSEMLARSMPEEPITEVPSQVRSSAGGDPMMALQARAESYGMPLEEYISILRSDPSFAEQELNAGLPVMGMAAGGVTPDPAMMAPPPGDMMAPPPGGAMAPGGEMAPPPGGEFDPAVFQGMLETAQTQFQGVDAAAENEDFGAMMNAIRGDEAPIEARYEELAEMVGPDDAQQTPESVLTLLQPVMQMAAVDQGIGGLAQDEMMAPVEGPMAEGIMSTVNMAPPPGAPAPAPAGVDPMAMAAPGGAAPVNFRQGGAVQYFNPDNDERVVLDTNVTKSLRPLIRPVSEELVIQADGLDQNGSVPGLGGRRGDLFRQEQALFQSLRGDQSAAYEEQKNMTKAQILFDIAQGALAFATPGATQMSPAERLAQVAQPVLGNIGARSGELLKFKQAQDAETKQLDLAALTSSGQSYQNELTRAATAASAKIGETHVVKDKDGTVLYTGPIATQSQQEAIMKKFPTAVSITEVSDTSLKAPAYVTFVNKDDPKDIRHFNKNDMSEANQTTMASVMSEVTADGNQKYFPTTSYKPTEDKVTASNRIVYKDPVSGRVETVNLDTEPGRKREDVLLASGYNRSGVVSASDTLSPVNLRVFVDKNDPTKIKRFDLGNPVQRKQANALGDNWLPTTMPTIASLTENDSILGNSYVAKFIELTANPDVLKQYATNELDPTSANLINQFISAETVLKPVYDSTRGMEVLTPGFVLSPILEMAITARSQIEGASLPKINSTGNGDSSVLNNTGTEIKPKSQILTEAGGDVPVLSGTQKILFNKDGSLSFKEFENSNTYVITGEDLTKSQDLKSSVDRFFNFFAGQFKGVTGFGSGYAGEGGKITSQADTQLNALARKIMGTARSEIGGKVFVLDVQMLAEEVKGFKPGGARTDVGARDQLVTVRQSLASMYNNTVDTLANPGAVTRSELPKVRKLQQAVGNLLAETTAAIAIYNRYIDTDPVEEAEKDRASVTGNLTRLNPVNTVVDTAVTESLRPKIRTILQGN